MSVAQPSLRAQSILALHTNNLLAILERIERLALPPAVLHAHIVLRLPPASRTLGQSAVPAKVDDTWDPPQARTKATANGVSFFDLRAAATHVIERFRRVAGMPGDVADVPDFQLVVPDGLYGCSTGEGGAESDQGDDDRFELHGCLSWCCLMVGE